MLTIDLTGRRALVTGGARGIGAAIVRVLAECGASVAFTHQGSEKGNYAATQMVDELTAAGRKVLHFVAAAEDAQAMHRIVSEAAEAMGGLDIVVPNVGVTEPIGIQDLQLSDWQHALNINLTASYIAIKTTLPWLLEADRGDIVLISSSAVVDGGGGSAAYSAAKAGLEGMMYALMRELPAKGIHINAVRPCVVDTDLLRERYDDDNKRAQVAAQVPLGRLAKPEDIAHLVAYLCSELGGFICGQCILVDGGRTLWRNR